MPKTARPKRCMIGDLGFGLRISMAAICARPATTGRQKRHSDVTARQRRDNRSRVWIAGANGLVTKAFKVPRCWPRIRASCGSTHISKKAIFQLVPIFKLARSCHQGLQKIRSRKETIILNSYRAGAGVVPAITLLHESWGYNAGVDAYAGNASNVCRQRSNPILRMRDSSNGTVDKELFLISEPKRSGLFISSRDVVFMTTSTF